MTFEEALEEIKAGDEECRKVIEEAERTAEEYIRKSMDDKKCPCCEWYDLEAGDTLYISSDWDGGIGFDYIRDIKYCPVCGRKLPTE